MSKCQLGILELQQGRSGMHVLVSACLMLMLGTERVALVGGDSTPGGMQTGSQRPVHD